MLGCVSYDPSVSTIWEKMRSYLNASGCPMDFMLFTNYEQQVAALLDGRIDVAWNGPIAHVMSQEYAGSGGIKSLGMRDCDRNFVSLCVARHDAEVQSVHDAEGKVVATGASDSPQAHVVPLYWLKSLNINPQRVDAFDIDLGKHGDTALGEIAAMEALVAGKAQVGLLSKMMWTRGLGGLLPSIDAKALAAAVGEIPGEAPPVFDHCQFDVLASNPEWKRESFKKSIFAMDMKNPEHTEVMKLEGISESWMPTREEGYEVLRKAMQASPISGGAVRTGGSATSARAFGTLAGSRRFASSASRPWSGQRRGCSGGAGASGPTVGVIGAGVAGLQTIRALRAKGFQVKAFDKASTVGGVWREGYINFGVQVPKQLFEFPDFPFNIPWGQYPTGEETQKYIEDYVDHFKLEDHLQLSCSVQGVEPSGKGWTFTVCENGGQPKEEHFDYCVVSTGMYSTDRPFMPEVPGKSDFAGEVLHSTAFQRPEQVEGKNVVVVGGCKSAFDCAVEASKIKGTKVTIVSRAAHWPTPRKIAWLIPFQYVFLSRLGQALVTGHKGPLPGAPAHMSLWHKLGWPVMAVAFKVVEMLFAFQFGNVAGKTSPLFKKDVVTDFYGYASVLDYSFRDAVKNGKIDWRMGEISSFKSNAAQVDGTEIPADVAIFGTGYQKDYSIFSEETRQKLNIENDGLYLWRHTIPADVANLAFVGSELACISNISSYGLQAAWLSQLWSGDFAKPSVEDMEKENDAMKTWKRSWMPNTPARASLVLLHQTHYHDILLKDMSLPCMRKMPNPLAEFLMPYHPHDYDGIVKG